MIQINELRLGNWVCFNTDNGPINMQVESIRKEAISSGFQVAHYDDDDKVFPIRLTPEILESCGFVRGKEVRDKNVFYYTGTILIEMQIILSGGVLIGEQKLYLFNKYEYLHQLQNLYFSLTGKELQINLTP